MRRETLVLFLLVVFAFVSCNGNKKESQVKTHEQQEPFIMTSQDTLDVVALSDSCMRCLKNGELESAIGLLYTYKNGTLSSIDNQQIINTKKRFSIFPVLDYSLVYMSFEGNFYFTFPSPHGETVGYI